MTGLKSQNRVVYGTEVCPDPASVAGALGAAADRCLQPPALHLPIASEFTAAH